MGTLDLHIHSYFSSDGEFSPEQLVEQCAIKNISTMAIADHNSVKAIPIALQKAKEKGISFIPAIELDCTIESVNLHILGYWIDWREKGFSEYEQNILSQEQKASEKRVQSIEQLGIYLAHEKLERLAYHGIITGEMIAEVALEEERNQSNTLLMPYRKGGERSDNPYVNFYWDFCSQGKLAYAPISYFSLAEAVELIQKSGGIAVLAHPGNNVKENTDLLNKIKNQKVVGIEVFSSYHTKEQTSFYLDYAKNNQLLITYGSDFHGKTKPNIQLGSVECDIEQEIRESLLSKRNKRE